MTVLAEKVRAVVGVAVNVDTVGKKIEAADRDIDSVAVVQIAFKKLAVPGGGSGICLPDVFAGPGDVGSRRGSVVVFQGLSG